MFFSGFSMRILTCEHARPSLQPTSKGEVPVLKYRTLKTYGVAEVMPHSFLTSKLESQAQIREKTR
jgi:hypothetical protein